MEKDNGIWTNRIAVQKAFDARPQDAYQAVASVLTTEQAAQVEAVLCPPPTMEQQIDLLLGARGTLVALDLDTTDVDAKIAALQGQ